jgi:hypothetical protein
MGNSALSYLAIAKDILLSPISFFRKMSITEGIRKATYFALIVYYIKCAIFFYSSFQQGYFFSPRFKAIPPVSIASFILISMIPFLLLLILYSQSIFLSRIANFFGGAGNLEAAYKVFAFVLFISLFKLIPFVDIIAEIYAIVLLIIGVREVFNVDWISSTLALFFSFIFTACLYILFFFIPLYFADMFVLAM